MNVYKSFKRLVDIFFSIFSILLLTPIFILTSFLIFFSDGFPIIYVSQRLGENKKIFKMFKFRTMKNNSQDIRNKDGSTFNSKNDPRLIKFGYFFRKSSLDELPQILNVLFGQMSFIGPRPDLPDHLNAFKDIPFYLDRFNVKPGISGYSQVKGRNQISVSMRAKLDKFYVDKIGLSLDIKIFFLTLFNVLFLRNIDKN